MRRHSASRSSRNSAPVMHVCTAVSNLLLLTPSPSSCSVRWGIGSAAAVCEKRERGWLSSGWGCPTQPGRATCSAHPAPHLRIVDAGSQVLQRDAPSSGGLSAGLDVVSENGAGESRRAGGQRRRRNGGSSVGWNDGIILW